jgi:hypothetical protein
MKLRSIPHSTGMYVSGFQPIHSVFKQYYVLGVCYNLRSIFHQNTDAIFQVQQLYYSHNSTAIAIEKASSPYLDTAVYQIFGISAKNSTEVVTERSAALLQQFATKFSEIYYPPASVANSLINCGIYWTLLIWFVISTMFLLRWVMDIQGLRAAAKEVI